MATSALKRLLPHSLIRRGKFSEHILESLRWYNEEHDPEENQETAPPDDEKIETQCVWIVEFYLPSHVEDLIANVDALGWGDPDRDDREGLRPWIQQHSLSLSSLGWKNLGIIARPTEKRFLGMYRPAPLPASVDFVRGSIDHLFPGCIAISLQFVLTDDAAVSLQRELSEERRTYSVPTRNGASFVTPFHQKSEACRKARSALRQACAGWFRQNLPGYFSAFSDAEFPAAEFITLRKERPFERLPAKRWNSYVNAMGLGYQFDVWESPGLPGLRAVQAREDPSVLILAAKESEFSDGESEERWQSYGGQNRHGFTNRLHHLGRTTTVWGLVALLRSWEGKLADSRNRLANVDLARAGKAAKQLEHRQRSFLGVSRDLVPLISDLKNFCEDRRWFHTEVYEFSYVPTPRPEVRKRTTFVSTVRGRVVGFLRREQRETSRPPRPGLFENLRLGFLRRADRIQELEREVRDAASSQASVLSGLAQNRAAGTMIVLTVVLIVLTAVILFLTVVLVLDTANSSESAPSAASPRTTEMGRGAPISDSPISVKYKTQQPK